MFAQVLKGGIFAFWNSFLAYCVVLEFKKTLIRIVL